MHEKHISTELSGRVQKILLLAAQEAQVLRCKSIEPGHLEVALFKIKDPALLQWAHQQGWKRAAIRRAIRQHYMERTWSEAHAQERPLDLQSTLLLAAASKKARKLGAKKLEPVHLLWTTLQREDGIAARVLQELGADLQQLLQQLEKLQSNPPKKDRAPHAPPKKDRPFLEKHGRNLTERAREGKLPLVVGRQQEIKEAARTLVRLGKNNPLFLGEAGVGKTSVAEGLAQWLLQPQAPDELQQVEIWEISIPGLVAGTSLRGEFEERLLGLLKEVEECGNVVLFLDEMHLLVGAGGSQMDGANILKPALARGEVPCIGASTFEEYRQYIEKDKALTRRFHPIRVEELTREQTLELLKVLKERLEEHHHVSFAEKALTLAVDLTVQYLPERRLPDKAIDVLDQAAAHTRIQSLSLSLDEVKKMAAEEEPPLVIGRKEVAQVVARWTGLPLHALLEVQDKRILSLASFLNERLVGQDHALERLAQRLRLVLSGLQEQKGPLASFLLLGPSGVGKTETARLLAEFFFHSPDRLLRLDMSEFQEAHSGAKLIGSPPGYVGYEQGGSLTEKLRRNPHTVLLLDEVEKAHPSLWDLFLQVFDQGQLTDSQGRTVSFSQVIILLTSNLGTAALSPPSPPEKKIGFVTPPKEEPKEEPKKQEDESLPFVPTGELLQHLLRYFRPELLNRIDEVLVYRSLQEGDLHQILSRHLQQLNERFAKRKISLQVAEEVKDFLVERASATFEGARGIHHTLEREVIAPLADEVLSGHLHHEQEVKVTLQDNKIVFEQESAKEQ